MSGDVDPGVTAADAKRAAQDPSTIAYLGDFGSAATAISLPLIERRRRPPGQPSEPVRRSHLLARRRPGRARASIPAAAHLRAAEARRPRPGPGPGRADALTRRPQRVRARRPDPFQIPLATILATDAGHAGDRRRRHDSLADDRRARCSRARSRRSSPAVPRRYSSRAAPDRTVATLARLIGPTRGCCCWVRARWYDSFTSGIGAARANTYLTTPVLPRLSRPPGSGCSHVSRRAFSVDGGPQTLYGYEAMSVMLDAIRAAGPAATIVRRSSNASSTPQSQLHDRALLDRAGQERPSPATGSIVIVDGSPHVLQVLEPGAGTTAR